MNRADRLGVYVAAGIHDDFAPGLQLLSDPSPICAAKSMTTDPTSRVVPGARHRKTRGSGGPIDQLETREKVARVRLGSYEFKKKGVSRFDLRDPYHLAIALT